MFQSYDQVMNWLNKENQRMDEEDQQMARGKYSWDGWRSNREKREANERANKAVRTMKLCVRF